MAIAGPIFIGTSFILGILVLITLMVTIDYLCKKHEWLGLILIIGALVLVWLGSGIYMWTH